MRSGKRGRPWLLAVAAALLCAAAVPIQAQAQEPPPLPPGLGGERPADEAEVREEEGTGPGIEVQGFVELRAGARLQEDPHEDAASLGELRLQTTAQRAWPRVTLRATADLLFDALEEEHDIRLERGQGALDLREAWVFWRATPALEVKAGRQVLTWGTGDLVFINDLFPKDWQSFFLGRDPEYLKAPSDAIKASVYGRAANLDLVYSPRFDPDRYLDGSRLSFFHPGLGRLAGEDAVLRACEEISARSEGVIRAPLARRGDAGVAGPTSRSRNAARGDAGAPAVGPESSSQALCARVPDRWLRDDELALRLYRSLGPYELAFYGYRGFWKSPAGADPEGGEATFPGLAVLGASVRGPVGPGIGSLEAGWLDSRDDPRGDDPAVRNGELRLLAGYEASPRRDLTLGFQYYLEHMRDHAAHRASLPQGRPAADRDHHVLTARITRLARRQDLTLSLFLFYSPSDRDAYLRPRVSYRLSDAWSVLAGANLFLGEEESTFFGQLENNGNLFAGARYGF
jgi:hypothetical protein